MPFRPDINNCICRRVVIKIDKCMYSLGQNTWLVTVAWRQLQTTYQQTCPYSNSTWLTNTGRIWLQFANSCFRSVIACLIIHRKQWSLNKKSLIIQPEPKKNLDFHVIYWLLSYPHDRASRGQCKGGRTYSGSQFRN